MSSLVETVKEALEKTRDLFEEGHWTQGEMGEPGAHKY